MTDLKTIRLKWGITRSMECPIMTHYNQTQFPLSNFIGHIGVPTVVIIPIKVIVVAKQTTCGNRGTSQYLFCFLLDDTLTMLKKTFQATCVGNCCVNAIILARAFSTMIMRHVPSHISLTPIITVRNALPGIIAILVITSSYKL